MFERFTLSPGCWYACEIIGDEFDEDKTSYSPIRVDKIKPLSARTFQLWFYHSNYPEGVRDKIYTLQTIERGKLFILARSVDHDPVRLLQIYKIDQRWISNHFGVISPERDVQEWLDSLPIKLNGA